MATLKTTVIDDTGALTLPTGTSVQRPSSPQQGYMRFNTDDAAPEVWDGTEWLSLGIGALDGSTSDKAALSPSALRTQSITTNGVYWMAPAGQAPYQTYVAFGVAGLDWAVVSGMSSGGVRGDINGNSSGLAGLNQAGENTTAAQLTTTGQGNNNAVNFTLPRAWINACNPKGLRVKSDSEDMVAKFDKTGSYVTQSDIWSYYYAMNGYDTIPAGNGRNHTAATVQSWLTTNVNIFADGGATQASGGAIVWTGNYHCGWSTSSDSRHMLHGSSNYSFAGPYPGFCLDNTCWNQSGIVWLAF